MQYKVGDVVRVKKDLHTSFAGKRAWAGKKMTVGTAHDFYYDMKEDREGWCWFDSDIAGPAESEKQKAMARLYCLISGINSKEITSHIENDTLSRWCNDWRVAAKEALRALGEDRTMDYEKLCEELRHYGTTYGTSLGLHMGIMDVAADTIEKLQAKYEEAARNFQQENAECRKLQAENERLEKALGEADR